MKTEAQKVMTELRTRFVDDVSLLKRTKVMRIIKFFPKNANQQTKRLLCYDGNNNVISVKNVTYITREEIVRLLPKRIVIIEDATYMQKARDFNYYI